MVYGSKWVKVPVIQMSFSNFIGQSFITTDVIQSCFVSGWHIWPLLFMLRRCPSKVVVRIEVVLVMIVLALLMVVLVMMGDGCISGSANQGDDGCVDGFADGGCLRETLLVMPSGKSSTYFLFVHSAVMLTQTHHVSHDLITVFAAY